MEYTERDIIYILNSLNIALHFIEWHDREEKSILKRFFNFNNYAEDYNNIRSLQHRIGLYYNRVIYNIEDEIYFKGQRDYLLSSEKDFDILKDKSRYLNQINKIININENDKFNYFINKFRFLKNNVDKNKKVV